MPDLNIKDSLKKILRAVESERYRDALALLTDILMHPTTQIPEPLSDAITQLLIFVFGKISILDRAVFAKQISTSRNLPGKLIERLLQETPVVSSHVILTAPFTDSELIDMIENGDLARRLSITQRANLTVPVTDQLVTSGELPVLVGLARNTTAKLSRTSFEVMASVASSDTDLDKALAVRSDIPAEVAHKLSRRVRAATEARMSKLIKDDLARKRPPLVLRGPGAAQR
jgi:uncharacterized protein (DUF2336 family)